MSTTITQLPLRGSVDDATYFATETSAITNRISASALKSYMFSGTVTSASATTGTFTNLSATYENPTNLATANAQITGGNVTGLTYLSATNFSAANAQITGGNVTGITTLNVTNLISSNASISGGGNITVGNLIGNLYGNIIGARATFSSNVSADYFIATRNFNGINGVYTGNVNATNFNGTGVYATSFNGTGNVNATNFNGTGVYATGNITATNFNGTGVYATGNVTANYFNGVSVQAQYADLAERYTSDSQYPPGTVLVFGTDTEVTTSRQPNDSKVVGVVSTNPAYTMNTGISGVDVALQGRVPCQVTGLVSRGDMMVTSAIPGVAMANNNPPMGAVIGKALGTHNSNEIGIIEVIVGRL